MIQDLHAQVKETIVKRVKKHQEVGNKGRKEIVFKEGGWVWLHLRKERFPNQRKSKLLPSGDGPFQVIRRINNNAYELNLPPSYNISSSFNVCDLSPFGIGFKNSWSNSWFKNSWSKHSCFQPHFLAMQVAAPYTYL